MEERVDIRDVLAPGGSDLIEMGLWGNLYFCT